MIILNDVFSFQSSCHLSSSRNNCFLVLFASSPLGHSAVRGPVQGLFCFLTLQGLRCRTCEALPLSRPLRLPREVASFAPSLVLSMPPGFFHGDRHVLAGRPRPFPQHTFLAHPDAPRFRSCHSSGRHSPLPPRRGEAPFKTKSNIMPTPSRLPSSKKLIPL